MLRLESTAWLAASLLGEASLAWLVWVTCDCTWDSGGKPPHSQMARGFIARRVCECAACKTQNGEPGGSPLASSVGRRGAEGVEAVRTAKAVCKR